MSFDTVIFIISALVAVFGATMMIVQRNPVASVLYLILSLVAQAVCYVQLSAVFMGAILIVVYAGAILVLFLFVIMLLNLRGTEELGESPNAVGRFTKYLVAILLTIELVFIVKTATIPAAVTGIMNEAVDEFGSVSQVAKLMFTDFLYVFELTGVLLLVAVVGAVVLAKTERNESHSLAQDEEGADLRESAGK
ncbi:MAG: NADH-quinone oxidoreductase subunit J [Candidatus Zixiibacteriota bacterium]|nr:MAG: NADH-quinone oxidoreductase subunit J [candidate division Zixibacteria bacterium]